jgi:hypothetical protein
MADSLVTIDLSLLFVSEDALACLLCELIHAVSIFLTKVEGQNDLGCVRREVRLPWRNNTRENFSLVIRG